ncbi:hypothetical protein [Nocardiopsis alba]
MSELPYTYTDVDGDTIKIEDGALLATATGDDVAVYVALPDRAKDAIALVRAILHAADVGTEYRVISEDWEVGEALVLSDAARVLSEIRVRDAAYDEGHADGLRMGTARADDKRLSDLEEQYTDLADLAEKLRADLGQAYAAVTGVGRLLRDHITAHQAHAAEVERRLTDLDGESP